MSVLSAGEILRVWEAGKTRHPLDRALLLLRVSYPGRTQEELARLRVGQRDALLLAVREQTFPEPLHCYTECPRCSTSQQFDLNPAELHLESDTGRDQDKLDLDGGVEVCFRLPNSEDLAAAVRFGSPARAGAALFDRCLLWASREGQAVDWKELPPEALTKVSEHMEECDPVAVIRLDLSCCECRHRWEAILDIAGFFWEEIAVQAKRLLREVHILAWAYGWREAEVLALPASRRQAYIEMVLNG